MSGKYMKSPKTAFSILSWRQKFFCFPPTEISDVIALCERQKRWVISVCGAQTAPALATILTDIARNLGGFLFKKAFFFFYPCLFLFLFKFHISICVVNIATGLLGRGGTIKQYFKFCCRLYTICCPNHYRNKSCNKRKSQCKVTF